ncbi:MAG: S8 family serine peptidase [Deltaproteobacteria bacterium]|nr:S8 family serine peptidase [Deltaproteobacteria bacterium]
MSAIVAGVAPGVRILPLDVFTGTGASSTHITAAINWVIANRATYNIAAMNLSLGSGAYTSSCPGLSVPLAITEARNAGILAAVASGNSCYLNALSQPACSPSAVSVGAVHDGSDAPQPENRVADFSNSASMLTLLAPGVSVTAGGITMTGTSQATPHVAGARAVLRASFPSASTDALVARLTNSGVQVTDFRNGITKPRLDLAAAAAGCAFKVTPASVDLAPAPHGCPDCPQAFTVTVTTGSACDWTVTSSDPAAFAISVGGLPVTGRGPGSFNVEVSANTGAARTATLTVAGSGADARTVTASQASGGGSPAGTACTASNQCNSGFCVDGVCCSTACTGTCSACNLAGNAGTCTPLSSRTDPASDCGATFCGGAGACLAACGSDADCKAGFVCSGTSCAAPPSVPAAPSSVPGTPYQNAQSVITWAAVPAWSNGGSAILDYTATSSPGGFTCTATGATATTCILTGLTNGTSYTVTVRARNSVGSRTASGTSASFKPANVPVAPTNAAGTSYENGQSVISWTAVANTLAGNRGDTVLDYTATASPGNFNCTATGATATTCTLTGLTNGTSYTVTVKARNNAGNSAASTASASFRPAAPVLADTAAPTGTLALAGGAAFTATPNIPVAITASDASAITGMCLSATGTCDASAWQPFSSSIPSFALPNTPGLKTVSAWLRDEWGNTTATPLTATITLDNVPPTGGALSAFPESRRVSLSWTGASDAGSGLKEYRLVQVSGTATPPAGCQGGMTLYRGLNTSFVASNLPGNATYTYRVCAVDALGNTAAGSTARARTLP